VSADRGSAALCHNIRFLGHTDLAGRSNGIQVMVYKDHAYVGQDAYDGFTIVNVSDPRRPVPAAFVPTAPNTWNHHLQVHDDLLLVVDQYALNRAYASQDEYHAHSVEGIHSAQFGRRGVDFSAGMRVYDISRPAEPRQIGFFEVEGLGLQRIWYDGGRYAYVSALLDGFSDHILLIVDLSDPTRPEEAGRWWIPGMWKAGGETPSWTSGRVALHHALVADGIAYGSWRAGGLTIVDVHDPSRPELLSHHNWNPPFGGGTHSALPLIDRELLVVVDQALRTDCADQIKYTWVFDIREKRNPVSIATFPTPSERDYCGAGGEFGPHNVHENRQGTFQSSEIIFVTYANAGTRAFSIKNSFRPEQIGYFVPPLATPSARADGLLAVSSTDVFVDAHGLMYVSDSNAGLDILEFTGA
jgi:hypothetical protein